VDWSFAAYLLRIFEAIRFLNLETVPYAVGEVCIENVGIIGNSEIVCWNIGSPLNGALHDLPTAARLEPNKNTAEG
jgi:hypothetical protein